jgi:phosphoglycolate phosphatase-like HAD superfamily hydrolase
MTEPLPSWRDRAAKQSIVEFVERVSQDGTPDFVAPADRIAVFDNDGTLWSEQPFYFQGLFAFDRVRAEAADHPDWAGRQPFKAVLDGDWQTLAGLGHKAVLEIVMATHAGLTTAEFAAIVDRWFETARHPTLMRPYRELVFAPMLELLAFLRANGFKTFIVSGGGIEFIRTFSEATYGVPPEQVIGSSIVTELDTRDGKPVLVRKPKMNFIDDGEGKPVGINQHIGRRPIAAFGNSDGDFQMLDWVTSGDGPRLGVLLHHDDADREFAYDRESKAGRLEHALVEAPARGWTVVSMREDWSHVFAG